MLKTLGSWVVKNRIFVFLIWIILLIPGAYGALNINDVLIGEANNPKGSENDRLNQLLVDQFPQQTIHNVLIVLESQKVQVSKEPFKGIFEKFVNTINQSEGIVSTLTFQQNPIMLSPDKKKTYLMINLDAGTDKEADTLAVALRNKLNQIALPDGIAVYFTGGPFFTRDVVAISSKDGFKAELRVLPLVLILLILVYGGLVAAGMPLLTGVISVTLTLGVLYFLGHYLEITSMSKNITTMIGLGVGIDYSLLVVNRFREEHFVNGLPKEEAAIHTVETAGRTILYSGLVVSIGMFALILPGVLFMQSLGLSGLIVVGLTLAVGLTLIPALLAQWGHLLNSPRFLSNFTNRLWGQRRFWYHWTKYMMKRPLFFTFVSIGMLVCISLVALEMKFWNSSIFLMPKEMEAREGLVKITEIDPKLVFSPIVMIVESKDGTPIWQEKNAKEVFNFAQAVVNQEPIHSMVGMFNPLSKLSYQEQNVLYQTIAAFGNLANFQTFQPGMNLPFISEDETKGSLILFHRFGEGYEVGKADLLTIKSMRKYRNEFENQFPNINIYIGGLSALPIEMESAIYRSFPLVVMVILVVTYLLTMFSFSSLLLPLKAVFLNVLSVTATYGWLVLVFQYGFLSSWLGIEVVPGALMLFAPIILFCIIFGLSMDYEIFLLNRIKEEYEKHQDLEEAIAQGMQKTGGIITSAGLVMILVFSGFAFSRIIIIKEFGLGMAMAIFIDATLIRLMVVPAIMKLMGKSCWYYPKFLKIPAIERFFKH